MAEEEYNDDIDQDDIDNLVDRATTAESKNVKMAATLATMAGEKESGNFLHHQISTHLLLDKLEHFYRGDIKRELNGDVFWEAQENKDLVTFNEFGVTSMMEVISKYIDRNTILSHYSEERIYEVLADIGDDLITFILSNYKQLGMDTYFKKTKLRITITTTTHMIESAYRRALKGRTLEELNQSKIVGQFGDPNNPGLYPGSQSKALNPVQKLIGLR